MKTGFVIFALSTTPYLAMPLMQESDFSLIFQFLSELPILIATIWLFIKLSSLHLETVDKLIATFGEREKLQRDHHKAIISELMAVIKERQNK